MSGGLVSPGGDDPGYMNWSLTHWLPPALQINMPPLFPTPGLSGGRRRMLIAPKTKVSQRFRTSMLGS